MGNIRRLIKHGIDHLPHKIKEIKNDNKIKKIHAKEFLDLVQNTPRI